MLGFLNATSLELGPDEPDTADPKQMSLLKADPAPPPNDAAGLATKMASAEAQLAQKTADVLI